MKISRLVLVLIILFMPGIFQGQESVFPDITPELAKKYKFPPIIPHRETTVDLNAGETVTARLNNGETATITLIGVEEKIDPIVGAIRSAFIRLIVNGESIGVGCGLYNRPITVSNIDLDCPAIGSLDRVNAINMGAYSRALEKDARIRLWPKGTPKTVPGTFVWPVRQKMMCTANQMLNEICIYGTGDLPGRKIAYHSSLDIGGSEGLVDVVAAAEGLVLSAEGNVLPEFESLVGTFKRYDVIYILDGRGWLYRYSHLKKIYVKPGDYVNIGDRIGILGKEGASGGWSHLHFEIDAIQPSGKLGEIIPWPHVWEAYLNEYHPKLIANARPRQVTVIGKPVVLDGTLSWSAEGEVASWQWILSNGKTSNGKTVEVCYDRPGFYSEILKISDSKGNIEYDEATVLVFDPKAPRPQKNLWDYPAVMHLNYAPSFNIKTGTSVTFFVRCFRSKTGKVSIDFGDGTPVVQTISTDPAEELQIKTANSPSGTKGMDIYRLNKANPIGYGTVVHSFSKPGHYIVRASHTDQNNCPVSSHVFVKVEKGE